MSIFVTTKKHRAKLGVFLFLDLLLATGYTLNPDFYFFVVVGVAVVLVALPSVCIITFCPSLQYIIFGADARKCGPTKSLPIQPAWPLMMALSSPNFMPKLNTNKMTMMPSTQRPTECLLPWYIPAQHSHAPQFMHILFAPFCIIDFFDSAIV